MLRPVLKLEAFIILPNGPRFKRVRVSTEGPLGFGGCGAFFALDNPTKPETGRVLEG